MTANRICTQKLTIPTLRSKTKPTLMWWRKFVQYTKMTNDIDLSTMTNGSEIRPQNRDQFETERKDFFF